MGIGDRLREERERLGMSQADFAALAGAHRKSQGNYELSARAPDAIYLAAIATAGADVLYILTGQRSNVPALSPRAQHLLDNYAAADDAGKRHIERAADLEAQSLSAPKRKAG